MPVTIVKDLKIKGGFSSKQTLVEKGGNYFVVSSANVPFSGFETLVFPATKDGDITKFLEVAGGRGMSHKDAIRDLETAEV